LSGGCARGSVGIHCISRRLGFLEPYELREVTMVRFFRPWVRLYNTCYSRALTNVCREIETPGSTVDKYASMDVLWEYLSV
jgi:hypothetical protein